MNPKVLQRISVRKRSGRLLISRSPSQILPEVGRAMQPRMLSRVVLPDPLGPLKTVTRSKATLSVTASRAVNSLDLPLLKIF